jgi:hypothetical protein
MFALLLNPSAARLFVVGKTRHRTILRTLGEGDLTAMSREAEVSNQILTPGHLSVGKACALAEA